MGQGRDTTLVEPGVPKLRAALDACDANTFVIFDTHWFTTIEHVAAGAARHQGTYTSEELPTLISDYAYDYPGAPALAEQLEGATRERGVRFLNATNPHLGVHYPTLNIVHYLHRGEAVLSIGVCQTAEAHNFLDLGACLARSGRDERPDARVALIGSGGMTHTFWPMDVILDHASYRPDDVISPEARAIDERVLGHWRDGDHAAVLDLYPEYRRFHPEGLLRTLPDAGRRARRPRLPHPRPAALRLRERRRYWAGARMVRRRRLKAESRRRRRMTLAGWTLPQTPTGRASTVPPPPWHYSGDIIAVDFTADPARVAELVPAGFSPRGDGSCTFFFCDWCSAADRDPRVKDDPIKGQYKEAYVDPERNLR